MEPACSQPPDSRPPVRNDAFDKELTRLLSFSVPTIGVRELKDIQNEVYIFDAREEEEYRTSHIEGRYLGYKNLKSKTWQTSPKMPKSSYTARWLPQSERWRTRLQKNGLYRRQ